MAEECQEIFLGSKKPNTEILTIQAELLVYQTGKRYALDCLVVDTGASG